MSGDGPFPGVEPGHPIRIGWKEWVALPDLGVRRIKAKVDTGARTGSLHVGSIRTVGHEPGPGRRREIVEIVLQPSRRRDRRIVTTVPVEARIPVKDSGGHQEERPVILTTLVLAGVRRRVRVTLTQRPGMLFRMLLGRKMLEGGFVVDPSAAYLGGRPGVGRPGETR